MLKNGAVEFYDVKQNSEACDFVENIPLGEYLYEERLPDEYVTVTDFGAAPDADYRVNTKAINEAISVVSQNGGGTVVIPEGIFHQPWCSEAVLLFSLKARSDALIMKPIKKQKADLQRGNILFQAGQEKALSMLTEQRI